MAGSHRRALPSLAFLVLLGAACALQPGVQGSCAARGSAGQTRAGRAQPLGFTLLASTRLGRRPLATRACPRALASSRPLLAPSGLRIPPASAADAMHGRASRGWTSACRLLPSDGESTGGDDDWDAYATQHDASDSEQGSEPALEDDPRAVHVPADAAAADEDAALLQSSAFGQVLAHHDAGSRQTSLVPYPHSPASLPDFPLERALTRSASLHRPSH